MSEFEPRYENKEQYVQSPEQAAEKRREVAELHEREAAKAEAERDSIEAIRERLEKAQQGQEAPKLQEDLRKDDDAAHIGSSGMLSHASKVTLRRVRKELSGSDRTLSKVVHQPVVEAVSNAAEVTVARPYGLLVGGLCSLLASLLVLYICRHYGYEYNFTIGLGALAGGFALGILGEGLFKLFKRLRK